MIFRKNVNRTCKELLHKIDLQYKHIGIMEYNMKRICLEEIEARYQLERYQDLYEKVLTLIEQEAIKPVKASGLNGKKPALYKDYWVIEKEEDYSAFIGELSYYYVPDISTDYYLRHIKEYQEDRKWLLLLNEYLKTNRENLETPMSMNERSFLIWHREKFLKEEQGKKILKRCRISMDTLNIYETTEPLAYYVHTREVPQNMLILENKDTFYSMRKALLSGENTLMGMPIGTLIYGAGKGVLCSFQDFALCCEPYMGEKENVLYYFGDLDYEGILIYEKLARLFEAFYEIRPFGQGYLRMLEKACQMGLKQLPFMKEGQNQNIGTRFWSYFSIEKAQKMQMILDEKRYIPQEILNVEDF